jgi:hypothetical protein
MYVSILERLLCNFFFFFVFVFASPIATASLQQFLAVAVAYKRAIISGMHNIASFFSTLLSDLRTDPDQES